jgi:hypothetical protein
MPVSVLDSTTAPTNRRARHSFGVLTDIRRAMIPGNAKDRRGPAVR